MTLNDGLIWVSNTKVRFGRSLQTPFHLFFPSCLCLFTCAFFQSSVSLRLWPSVSYFGFCFLCPLSACLSIPVPPSLNNLFSISDSYLPTFRAFSTGIPLATLNMPSILLSFWILRGLRGTILGQETFQRTNRR